VSPFWDRFKPRPARLPERTLAVLRRGVDRVDPRLVQACPYPDPYLPALSQSLAYVEGLVSAIPGPLQINREAFLHQPLVRALFAAPDEIAAALCRSPEARAYAENHGGSCHGMWALLTAEPTVRHDFGPGEVDGFLVRDLPRQIWNFDHYTLLCPGESESAVRTALALRLLDGLFDAVAERRARRRVENQLAALAKETDNPADPRRVPDLCGQIEDFNAVLGAPEAYLSLHTQEVSMDALGTIADLATSAAAGRISLLELRQHGNPPRVVALIQCQGDGQPPSLRQGLQDIRHWMG
jgi:hypothetical protein